MFGQQSKFDLPTDMRAAIVFTVRRSLVEMPPWYT